jgi:outer membrane murein-binding lipoprotein Lpp
MMTCSICGSDHPTAWDSATCIRALVARIDALSSRFDALHDQVSAANRRADAAHAKLAALESAQRPQPAPAQADPQWTHAGRLQCAPPAPVDATGGDVSSGPADQCFAICERFPNGNTILCVLKVGHRGAHYGCASRKADEAEVVLATRLDELRRERDAARGHNTRGLQALADVEREKARADAAEAKVAGIAGLVRKIGPDTVADCAHIIRKDWPLCAEILDAALTTPAQRSEGGKS